MEVDWVEITASPWVEPRQVRRPFVAAWGVPVDGGVELPWVETGSISVDLAGRTLSWAQTGDGAYDGATVWTAWDRPGVGSFQWVLIVPAGVSTSEIPALPAEITEIGTAPTDRVEVHVVLLEISDVEARLHELPMWRAICPACPDPGRENVPLVIQSSP